MLVNLYFKMKLQDYELEYDFLEASKKGTLAERLFHPKRVKAVLSLIKGNNLNILELGCGTGLILVNLAKNNKATGMDISEWCILKAREHSKKRGVNPNLLVGNISAIPLKPNSFDVIVMAGVVEHLRGDLNKVVFDVCNLLKKDGKLIVSVPYSNPLNPLTNRKIFDFLRRILSGRKDIDIEDFHQHFSVERLKNLFKGFKALKVKKIGFGIEVYMLFQKIYNQKKD